MIFRYWGFSFADYDADSTFPDFDPDIRPNHWKASFGEEKGDCYFVNWKDHELELNNSPTINFFENSRYVVLKSIGKKRVLIMDPEFGEVNLSREEWEQKASDVVIYFIPKNKPEQNWELKNRFFAGLAEYFLPAIQYLKAGIVASFVIKGLEVFIPLVNLYLIDAVLLQENKEFFFPVILVVVLLSFSQSFLAYFRSNVIFFTKQSSESNNCDSFFSEINFITYIFF